MIVQISTRRLSDMGIVFLIGGGLMSMFNNKEFSISKQATIRDTDAGKRFSSSLNAAACFLSNPEGMYLFILSDQKTFGC